MEIKSLLKTSTLRQSSITLVGTVINGLLGMVFYLLAARWLGPAEFGLLALSITVLTLVADVADLGTNTGLVRFVSANLTSDRPKAYRFLKLSLEVKLVSYLVVLIFGWMLAPWLADVVFDKPELVMPLRLAFIGVGGAMLFSFTTAALQAFEKFKAWSLLNIIMNGVRVVVLVILSGLLWLSLESAMWLYILIPFIGFVIGWVLLPLREVVSTPEGFRVGKEMFKFNRWVALFILIAAVSARLDTFLGGRFLTTDQLGIYGASNQLAQTVSQLVVAIGVVVAPKFSSFDSRTKMWEYFKKLQLLVVGLAILILIALPIVAVLLPILYGSAYSSMVPIFSLLTVSGVIFLISVPVHNSIIYYYSRSDIFVWVSLGHLLIVGCLGWILVQSFGPIGLAMSVVVGTTFNLLLPAGWWWRLFKR